MATEIAQEKKGNAENQNLRGEGREGVSSTPSKQGCGANLIMGLLVVVIGFALLLIWSSQRADVHVDNLTPEVHVAAPQVNVAPSVCNVTNQVFVAAPNFEEMRSSFALLGDRVMEAEKMRIDFEKQRIDSELKRDIELRTKKDDEAARYARNAMFYINHINMVVTKIITYNNPAVLEEEYNAISLNSIRLDTIKDIEVIDVIQDIMDYITEMRLQERQRAMLKEELDQGLSDALVSSLSGIGTGGAISPAGMAINLVTSAACAGMNYKKAIDALKNKFKKEEWKLENEKIKELNELNKSLLKNYWLIMQRYGLDDTYRITEEQITRLFARLKDADAERRYRFLKQNEKAYTALPIYWFYRGEAAYGRGEIEYERCKAAKDWRTFDDAAHVDAVNAFCIYQSTQDKYNQGLIDPYSEHERKDGTAPSPYKEMSGCGKILRRDPTAAKVAMLYADTLLQLRDAHRESEYDTPENFKKQIKLIVENTLDDEWSMRYYAASLCGRVLNDVDKAKEILQLTIDELESRRDNNLVTWADMADGVHNKEINNGTTNSVNIIAPGDAIMRCKELIIGLEAGIEDSFERDKMMRELCECERTSAREKIFMYGAMRYKDALKYLKSDIEKISAVMTKGKVKIKFPLSWIRSREGDMKVIFLKNPLGDVSHCKTNNPYFGNSYGMMTEYPFVEDVSDADDRKVENGKCTIVFNGKKLKFKARTMLLVIDYGIRDGEELGKGKEENAQTRMVLEYEVPEDGSGFRLKRAVLGKYDAKLNDEAANWIDCCEPIEFK